MHNNHKPQFKPTGGGPSYGPTHTHTVQGYPSGHTHGNTGNNMGMQASHIFYYFENEVRIALEKNRHGPRGEVTPDQFLDFALAILANKSFNNTARVFQEGLIEQLKEAINKVLQKNFLKVVNTNDTI